MPTDLPSNPATEPPSAQTASWGRRLLALFVDWLASIGVVVFAIGIDGYSTDPYAGWLILGVFVLESSVLTALMGGSFGQLATRLRVVRADGSGRPITLPRAVLRQVLVALVLPPLVYRPDGRGLHDLLVGSATATLVSTSAR